VLVERVVGDARHRDRRAGRLAACGQRDVEQPRGALGVAVEELVEIAHPIEQQPVRMLVLEPEVLLHHRRVFRASVVQGALLAGLLGEHDSLLLVAPSLRRELARCRHQPRSVGASSCGLPSPWRSGRRASARSAANEWAASTLAFGSEVEQRPTRPVVDPAHQRSQQRRGRHEQKRQHPPGRPRKTLDEPTTVRAHWLTFRAARCGANSRWGRPGALMGPRRDAGVDSRRRATTRSSTP
jgi:hypothetical protein